MPTPGVVASRRSPTSCSTTACETIVHTHPASAVAPHRRGSTGRDDKEREERGIGRRGGAPPARPPAASTPRPSSTTSSSSCPFPRARHVIRTRPSLGFPALCRSSGDRPRVIGGVPHEGARSPEDPLGYGLVELCPPASISSRTDLPLVRRRRGGSRDPLSAPRSPAPSAAGGSPPAACTCRCCSRRITVSPRTSISCLPSARIRPERSPARRSAPTGLERLASRSTSTREVLTAGTGHPRRTRCPARPEAVFDVAHRCANRGGPASEALEGADRTRSDPDGGRDLLGRGGGQSERVNARPAGAAGSLAGNGRT